MNTRRRIALLIAYLLCSVLLAWVLAPWVYGLPHSLLGSWGYILGLAFLEGLSKLFPDLGQTIVAVVVLLSFALYLVGLLLLNNVLRQALRFPVPIISLIIHSVGFFLCLIIWPSLDVVPSARLWIPPVVLILVYFFLEWRLARRSGRQVKSVETSAVNTAS